MSLERPEDPLRDSIRRHLDAEADNLDAATVSQLRRARSLALQHATSKWYGLKPSALWAGGLVAVCTLAVSLGVWLQQPASIDGVEAPLLADTELLLDEENLDFYEELEFYLWLQAEGLVDSDA